MENIAFLKDIDAYDFGQPGMISILLDSLKQEMIEVEKIIQREKDRKASRKDRKTVGGKKIAFAGEGTHHSNNDTQYAYILDTSVNNGYGGFIMTTKRVREDVDEDRQSTDQMRSQKPVQKQARAKEKAPREVKVKD